MNREGCDKFVLCCFLIAFISSVHCCKLYEEYNLCSLLEGEAALKEYSDIKNDNCRNHLEILSCGFYCLRQTTKFIRTREKTNTYYICDSFCDSLYNACRNESIIGIGPVSATWMHAKDFCEAQTSEDYQISVIEDKGKLPCFTGNYVSARGQHSSAYGSGLYGGIATQTNHFYIDLRNRNDQPVAHAQKFIQVKFLWRLSEGDLLVEPDITISDLGNGTYNVTYTLETAGTYDILIVVQGNHVRGSPFVVEIAPRLSCMRGTKFSEKFARNPDVYQGDLCSNYYDNACCTSKEVKKIDSWLKGSVAPAFKGDKCLHVFETLRCGILCTPNITRFATQKDSVLYVRVCDNFCQTLFRSCVENNLMGFNLNAIYTRYQDFCLAQSEESIRIEVTDRDCFGV